MYYGISPIDTWFFILLSESDCLHRDVYRKVPRHRNPASVLVEHMYCKSTKTVETQGWDILQFLVICAILVLIIRDFVTINNI